MGRKLVLTGTKLTDLTAPKLAGIDTILPDAGALVLLDPANPVNPWPTFDLMSTSGTVVMPNLALAQAQVMYPSGTAATLGATYLKGNDFLNDGIASKVERTSKGGLHTIMSQTAGNTAAGGRVIQLFFGSALNSYIQANKGHSFYSAYWGKLTRSSQLFDSGAWEHSQLNGQNDVFGFYTRPAVGGTQYPATNIGNFGENTQNTTGKTNLPIFQDVAIANASVATVFTGKPYAIGAQANVNAYRSPSMIFYGFYMEDLTVSGRSYATVSALMQAKYNKDVKTVGGRYYGDTFTDPATIP